ncbi:MAG: MATE family efflux transporter [Methanoregulaceae archaeon]
MFSASEKESGITPAACPGVKTQGIEILTSGPKSAILRLSLPMILAMLLMSSYNLVNAIWVAGLGPDALAAIGFISPMYMVLIGLGTGIGAGATSAISRRIGAGDCGGAGNVAVHSLVITLVTSLLITIPLVLFAEPISAAFGAGSLSGLATEYGIIIYLGSVFIIFANVGYGILRAEGDSKRTMYAMIAGTILNIILDPVLIYGLNLGIAGAAWGTVISVAVVSFVLLYWFFVKKNTYIRLSPGLFSPSRALTRDILTVGLPASVEYLAMSVMAVILNYLLQVLGGSDAVAVFSVGFRVVSYGIVPIVAIGTVVVSVTGAAYGANLNEKIREAHTFSILFGFFISLIVSLITYVFAYPIAALFSYSADSAGLYPEIAAFLGVMCFFYPFVSFGALSSSVLQGMGKGPTSLFLTVMRTLVFVIAFAWLFAFPLNMGEKGIWWGIIAGEITGGILAFIWVRVCLLRLPAPSRISGSLS